MPQLAATQRDPLAWRGTTPAWTCKTKLRRASYCRGRLGSVRTVLEPGIASAPISRSPTSRREHLSMNRQGVSEEILVKVQAPWRVKFIRFIETGDLDPVFEAFLDTDEESQQAVEEAVQAQARALESFGRVVRGESSPPGGDEQIVDTVAKLDAAIKSVSQIRPERWPAAARAVSGALRSARSLEEQNALKQVLAEPVKRFLKA